MLAERTRALRLLSDRSARPVWIGRLAWQVGEWLLLLALLEEAWLRDSSVAGWVVVARFLPRPILLLLPAGWTSRISQLGTAPVVAAAGALAALVGLLGVAGPEHSAISSAGLVGFAAAIGLLAALAGAVRGDALARAVDRRQLGALAGLDALVDRTALVVGPLVAVVLLVKLTPSHVLIGAALLLGLAAVMTLATSRRAQKARSAAPSGMAASIRQALNRQTAIYHVAAFGSGALAGGLLTAIFVRQTSFPSLGSSGAGIALAAIGAGMLIGPLPVPRVLLRISAPLLVLAAAGFMSLTAILAVAIYTAAILPLLIGLGIAAVTLDSVRAVALRRLVPAASYRRTARLSLLALGAGQVGGALAMLGAPALGGAVALISAIAVVQLVLVAGGLVIGGLRESLQVGALSALPIRSVVHRLSWATDPPPMAADFTNSAPRARRLAKWITQRVDLQRLRATLPISRREYEVYRPDEASRERLFEEGRADPDKQMPYWAKVWPSGVALADVVVERHDEVAGRLALELGAGLGVTAAAVLEAGGQLVTADYSDLPLAHCRLNTLVNTGRAPTSMCFNWRHDAEIRAATSRPEFEAGFPLILAADVLYEGRDAEPLLNVVEHLLQADGSLWLAEPVRRTAQRFLDTTAALGWDTASRQVQADWPDATSGPVNLHFLTRSSEPDRIAGDLGGWRL